VVDIRRDGATQSLKIKFGAASAANAIDANGSHP
jgi:hypothetical protein